jgi:aminoglycoside phosphotransferase family enzyme/predicted kinase
MKKTVHDRPAWQWRAGGVDADADFERRVAALANPSSFPVQVDSVQVVRTAGAALFLTEDRVYKLKRPADFELPDDGGADGRRRSCEEEVRLNRRISPGVYLGVVPVTLETDGRILLQGKGAIVDWAIEMVRLPADRMLDHMLDHGGVSRSQLEKVAFVLARFHERAMTGPEINEHGLPSSIVTEVRDGFADLRALCARHPDVLDEFEIAFLEERSLGFLAENRELLERRVAMWRIRDGHGDLGAGNICLPEGGVVVYDCEVDRGRHVRFGDVARDLALLVLDLDDRGNALEAEILVEACSRLGPDEDLEHLVGFYRVQRALERTRNLLLSRDEDPSSADAPSLLVRARQLAQLALGYELDGGLVLVGGTDAAERGTLARYVSSRLRAVLLAGDPADLDARTEPADRSQPGSMHQAQMRVEREHRRVLDVAVSELERGRAVVVESSFAHSELRRRFVEAAERLERPATILWSDRPDAPGLAEPVHATEAERVLRSRGGRAVEAVARELIDALIDAPAAPDQELSERPMP